MLCRKKMSMLKDLKASMLKKLKSSKVEMCILQNRAGDNQRRDFEGLEMQNKNIPMGGTQQVDNKSGLIYGLN